MTGLAVPTAFVTPAEGLPAALGLILFCGLVFLAIHAGHLHFAARATDE